MTVFPPQLDPRENEEYEERSVPIPDWQRHAVELDVDADGHEVYCFRDPYAIGGYDVPESHPSRFGDINPNKNGPDMSLWPIEKYDPGAPGDGSLTKHDLNCRMSAFPIPHVKWVTDEYITERAKYNDTAVEVPYENLPRWRQPDKRSLSGTVKLKPSAPRMKLTKHRKEGLRREVNFYNGREVRGAHILFDKLPDVMTILGDIPDDELYRLYADPSRPPEIIERFRDHDWFEKEASVFLKPQRILRKKVWYAPTLAAKKLVNARDDLPSFRGDPMEGLEHRVTVGLAAVYLTFEGYDIDTYVSFGDYNVDLVATRPGERKFVEVMTGHNNWKLHRETYRKLSDLRDHGTPLVAFDSRKTAYQILNHWHNQDLAILPHGTFDTEFNINDGRDQIQTAYNLGPKFCNIADWWTTEWLWRNSIGSDRTINRDDVISLTW
ncbi:hypothetical protein [Halorientalis marina]|uniref:hypothetical protein n=1 Tax=Halorientalis marina TaxID=2931976 RepID=UPI001FF11785|nr:hypothetical protein [Halorientalis marina]